MEKKNGRGKTGEWVIDDIHPFNNLLFKTCFYNSLFAALNYYNVDIMTLIINSVPQYYISANENLALKYDLIENETVILNQLGIFIHTMEKEKKIEDFIKDSIIQKRPIIAHVDWYYMENQSMTFMKKHRWHRILVFGCDESDKKYNIFDQKYADTLTYSQAYISYNSLEQANAGCNDKYGNTGVSCVEFIGERSNPNCFHNIANTFLDFWESDCHIKLINTWCVFFGEILNSRLNKHDIYELINSLSDIIHQKKIENFVFLRLKVQEAVEINHKIIGKWEVFRATIIKCGLNISEANGKNEIVSFSDSNYLLHCMHDIVKYEEELMKHKIMHNAQDFFKN